MPPLGGGGPRSRQGPDAGGRPWGGWPQLASAHGRALPGHGSESQTSITGKGPSDYHPNLCFTYANAAKKSKVDFKIPLPIPEWKNLEIRIFKTSHRQLPISHQEFNSIRDKLYQYVLNYLQNNPDNACNTEASHNHWSAALQ
jgi:hypothetical protein